jgi:hypothetical protein
MRSSRASSNNAVSRSSRDTGVGRVGGARGNRGERSYPTRHQLAPHEWLRAQPGPFL